MKRPNERRLLEWLDTDLDRLERHIANHPEDIERIDQLSALDDDVKEAVAAELPVPDDIVSRTRSRMRTDVRWQQPVGTLADLFTLPYLVGRTVVGGTDPDLDRNGTAPIDNPHDD